MTAAREHERRFLVASTEILRGSGNRLDQGYLFDVDGYVVRVRRSWSVDDDSSEREGPAMMTTKGPRIGASRIEYEMEIDPDFAGELLERAIHRLTKRRYQVISVDDLWDVDVFEGENAGLVIAEIEKQEGLLKVHKPWWCEREITQDRRYDNEALARNPYLSWAN